MSTWELEVRPHGAAAFRVPLEPVPFRIGRSPENHLVLRDTRASRTHALIRQQDNAYIIQDDGSRNGIEVNGVKVESHTLQPGDIVRFGVEDSYEITFVARQDVLQTQVHHGGLRKLRSMLEVARSLQGASSIDHILGSVVDSALAITNCDRGFLLLAHKNGLRTRIARDSQGKPLTGDDLEIPCTILLNAVRTRSELLTMRFDATVAGLDTSILNLSLKSIVCVPLIKVRAGELAETSVVGTIADTVGLLYLDSKQSHAELTGGSRDLLQSLAIEASFVLENARLLEEERKKVSLEQELQIAQTIQRDLLPDQAQFPSSGWLQASGLSIPSKTVGGDYFDLIPIGDDRYDIIMADVSGKGVSSALLASLLQGAFVLSTAELIPPAVIFDRLNKFLLGRTSGGKYVTIFLASVYRDQPMQWANAGHCSPLLMRQTGEIFELTPTGMPVGMLEEGIWTDAALQMKPGDTLVCYTDGVTEAANPIREQYGLDRLAKLLQANRAASPAELTRLIRADLDRFTAGAPQRDDVTMLILRFNPN